MQRRHRPLVGLGDAARDGDVGARHLVHQRLQQRHLVLEIEIDAGLAEPGPGRHLLHPGGGEAFLRKEVERRSEDFRGAGLRAAAASCY